jgi:hypothetical protein
MRRDQNDHAKANSQPPDPEGSGRKHCKTELPMRLLAASILKTSNFRKKSLLFFIHLLK